jgi:hypothetical protein
MTFLCILHGINEKKVSILSRKHLEYQRRKINGETIKKNMLNVPLKIAELGRTNDTGTGITIDTGL